MSAGIRERLEAVKLCAEIHEGVSPCKACATQAKVLNKTAEALLIAVAALGECSKAAKTMGDIEEVYFRNQERAKKALREVGEALDGKGGGAPK